MSKLDLDSRVPTAYSRATFADIFRAISVQVNNLSEGRLDAKYNAQASVPTTTSHAAGDFVPDNNCTVRATVVAGLGASYIRLGWVCVAPGTPGTFEEARLLTGGGTGYPSAGAITNSIGADVALNNTSNFFDGPSVAQGTAGTWFVSGTVNVHDTSGIAAFHVKLWDGTTVISSARVDSFGANRPCSVTLSGFITSPAGNLRISARDVSSTSGVMAFNNTGTSKDGTITAIRIG